MSPEVEVQNQAVSHHTILSPAANINTPSNVPVKQIQAYKDKQWMYMDHRFHNYLLLF